MRGHTRTFQGEIAFHGKRPAHTAFTLIELLALLAVIALLASLLLPALSKARSSAVSLKCQSHLKQWGLALNMYVNDFDRYLPHANGNEWWHELLQSYLAEKSLPHKRTTQACPGNKAPVADYGYNLHGVLTEDAARAERTPRLGSVQLGLRGALESSKVLAPSEMIALGDAFKEREGAVLADPYIEFGVNYRKRAPFNTELEPWASGGKSWAKQRHGSKCNVVFCDGHIECWKNEKLFLDRSDTVLRKWNNDHEPHRELLLEWRR